MEALQKFRRLILPEPLNAQTRYITRFTMGIARTRRVSIQSPTVIGLVSVYIKIFLKSNSKYIVGLLFFLFPLLIQSIFSVNTLRSLFVSSAIPFKDIRESVGFGLGGLGGILVVLSLFEILGLSILLYLSAE